MSDGDEPIGAIIVSIIAAVLILVDGVLVVFSAETVQSDPFATPAVRSAAGALSGLGGFEAFCGFVILLLALGLYLRPDAHVGLGIGILVLSLLSLVAGGGFILGLILGLVGGVLAIIFDLPEEGSSPSNYAFGIESGYASAPAIPRFHCPSCSTPYAVGTPVCERCGARLLARLPGAFRS